ncbi:MAG TPA: GxxExxY protein [Caulobacteraceae bacterium]|nr:GxxExxY protein [Caulobacteraceae bacterium]
MSSRPCFNAETAERPEWKRNQLGEKVLGCALKVHKALGPGLLENAYESCLAIELQKSGLELKRQLTLPVVYDGAKVDLGYRLDLLVEGMIVVEVKAIERLAEIHRAQVLSYLKLGGYRLGYLLNFNVKMMRNGIYRIANGL